MMILKTFNTDILLYCFVMFIMGLTAGRFFFIKQFQVWAGLVLLAGIIALMFSCEKRGLINVE
jgi:hypothetical protein